VRDLLAAEAQGRFWGRLAEQEWQRKAARPKMPRPEPSSSPTPAKLRLTLKAWVKHNRPDYALADGELARSLYERMAADAVASGAVKSAHWTTVRDYVKGKSNKR
jgi:hypothetical protein